MASDYGAPRYVAHQRAALQRPDRMAVLDSIRVPTLIAVGRDDAVTPPALHAAMAELIPGSTLAVVDRSAHMLPLEREELVSQHLVELVADAQASLRARAAGAAADAVPGAAGTPVD